MVTLLEGQLVVAVELVREGDRWDCKQIAIQPLFDGSAMRWPEEALETIVSRAIDRVERRAQDRAELEHRLATGKRYMEGRMRAWHTKGEKRGNREYAALAAAYCEELGRGNSRATAALAARMNVSPALMAQRIKEARRRLLLTPGEQGRASGELTRLGILYLDPNFPGIARLAERGKSVEAIANEYELPTTVIEEAMVAEGMHGIPDARPEKRL